LSDSHDSESTLVASKLPCPHCTSSDGYHEYSDGHGYCFSCEAYDHGDKDNGEPSDSLGTLRVNPSAPLRHRGSYQRLLKRRLDETTCKKFEYKITEDGLHASPYYRDGVLVAVHYRNASKSFWWDGDSSNVELFGQHLWPSTGRNVIVTEGELDCLSYAQAQRLKWPVVSVPSGAQSALKAVKRNLEWLSGYTEIVIAFDADEPGRKAAEEVAAILEPGKAKIVSWPTGMKDASDVLTKGGGEDQLRKLMWDAPVWRPDGIVGGEDLWGHVEEFWARKPSEETTPWPGLTKLTFGLRPKEVWTWTAGTGVGKSTAVHEVMFHNLNENPEAKWGVVALEESTGQSVIRTLSMAHNRLLHLDRDGMDINDVRAAFDKYVKDRVVFYDHWGATDSGDLLGKVRYMAAALGVTYVLFDHVSIAVTDAEDERREIDSLMTKLRTICENTGVGVHCVCHLKRVNSQSGKGHEDGQQVRLGHLRGSGSIAQISDTVLALERDLQDGLDFTKVRVLKCRFTGKTGLATRLQYNEDTGRLTDAGLEDELAGFGDLPPKSEDY